MRKVLLALLIGLTYPAFAQDLKHVKLEAYAEVDPDSVPGRMPLKDSLLEDLEEIGEVEVRLNARASAPLMRIVYYLRLDNVSPLRMSALLAKWKQLCRTHDLKSMSAEINF
jgi:hypothetical protein